MRQPLWCGIVLCAAITQGAGAQMQMGPQQQSLGGNQSVMAALLQPVTGEPYQAVKLSKSSQTLSDGTVLTHETKGMIARDAEGRIREDLYIVHSGQMNGRETDLSLQSATVGDPVAHTMLIWTGETAKIAMQMQLPNLPPMPKTMPAGGGIVGGVLGSAPPPAVNLSTSRPASTGALAPPPGMIKDQVRTEDLGQQSLEGVLVTGKRTTTTVPLGKVGNDRPFDVVHEEWRSPELNILVKTLDKDPRTGVQTMELENLVRTDPDAALFHAPAGYTVQDMAAMLKGIGDIGRGAAK
jgi:hypothetical protein